MTGSRASSLARHAIARCVEYLLALFILSSLNFVAVRALPGDPLDVLFADATLAAPTGEDRDQLRRLYGLDGGLMDQFVRYLGHLAEGDLGVSVVHGLPVVDLILPVAPWTLLLVGTATALSVLLGTVGGIETGLRHGRRGSAGLLAVLTLADSIPPFVLAIVLLFVFALGLELFPASGAMTPFSQAEGLARLSDIALHAVLPLTALVLHETTKIAYLTRASTITVLSRPFMTMARAKGVSPLRLRSSYVAPSTLATVVARTAALFSGLVSGVLFVEIVFAYPGLGMLVAEGITSRDYAVVQGVLLILGVTILTVNLIADLVILRLAARG
ncbi:ABC transporter permease [Roseospira visakhapatnamensis]|uniref:Peptide/nickel transport system permease protein n=1 Tax=Roseospira visakhapatnamensis TaxID=390880 RepID=A0A7W6RGB1_9PROT|nr:ABC transporter permease [Roseospira visakhapatnamensis]MBB4268028.1 peptide/nickel transport system permease protein [Roseospira visakhapatnamensis]